MQRSGLDHAARSCRITDFRAFEIRSAESVCDSGSTEARRGRMIVTTSVPALLKESTVIVSFAKLKGMHAVHFICR